MYSFGAAGVTGAGDAAAAAGGGVDVSEVLANWYKDNEKRNKYFEEVFLLHKSHLHVLYPSDICIIFSEICTGALKNNNSTTP